MTKFGHNRKFGFLINLFSPQENDPTLKIPFDEPIEESQWDLFKQAFLPWEEETFTDGGLADKIVAVVVSPVFLLCKLTIPVVGFDERETWNRPLSMIQGLLIY